MSGDQKVTLHAGRFLRLIKVGRWEYADRIAASGAVVIVPLTDDGRLILIEQFRVPVERRVIEFPAGIAGDIPEHSGEALADAARRELLEETGWEAAQMVCLGSGPPSPGLASEVITFFKASGLRRVNHGGGDEHEDIQVHEVPRDQVQRWLKQRVAEGLMIYPKIYAGLYLADALT